MHWFTANSHYSHGNIIRFCDRPFPDVATMNTHLLAECRARVGPDDDLWILPVNANWDQVEFGLSQGEMECR